MTHKAISPLRQRMIEDMSVRKFCEKAKHDYVRHVELFATFLGRSPATATGEDLRRYQLHQTENGVQPPSFNSAAVALRFLFLVTLGRPDLAHQLTRLSYPRKLPRILSPEDVARLLEAAPGPGLKYKAALSIAYGAGLRAAEVAMLRTGDIESSKARAARTGMRCSRRSCWRCCAPGGSNAARKAGCFRAAIPSCR
jgi:site-specific recombinase XerD